MKKKRPSAAAYHEAGHAVAAILLDCLRSVTITSRHSGHTHVDTPENMNGHNPSFRQWAKHRLVFCLAGMAAQRRAYPPQGTTGEFGLLLEAMHDHDEAVRMITELNPPCPIVEAFIVQAEADVLIERHWHEIERVAEALMKRKTLAADEVRETMGSPPHGDQRQRGASRFVAHRISARRAAAPS